MINLPIKQNRLKYGVAVLFLLSCLFFPVSSQTQVLYENEDNIITINVPGVQNSKLIATAEGGTLVHKGADKWIARPTGEKDTSGVRKDFVIKVFVNKNGKKELLSTKAYEVKTAYIIYYYDRTTHNIINKKKLVESDDVLLKADGIEKICFTIYLEDLHHYHPDPVCDRFSDEFKRFLKTGVKDKRYTLIITEAWNTSGQKVKLPPIKLTYYPLIDGIHYEFSQTSAKVVEVFYSGNVVIPSRVTHKGKEYYVTSIGAEAFMNCSNLTSVTIPGSVTTIEKRAFYECTGLTSITIPASIKRIEQGAFERCPNLLNIICLGQTQVPYLSSNDIFDDGVYTNATLSYPAAIAKFYDKDPVWGKFINRKPHHH
jgi:hypothetical protein